jgi:NitT/TauT family transport system substrate-binding protein
MLNNRLMKQTFLLFAVMALILSACGSKGTSNTESVKPASSTTELIPIKLQLKWVPQSQFAGYFVALNKGYYEKEGLKVEIVSGGPDIVSEQQVASGAVQFGVDWTASMLAHRDQGLPLVQIAQIFQNSASLLISRSTSGIKTPADLKGKVVGNPMGGNEFEVLALFDKYKLDPAKDMKFVKQGFTVDQFVNKEIDTMLAMSYNEYFVLLDSGFKPEDLSVIDLNKEGTAMLQDNLFTNEEWLAKNQDTAAKFLRASLKGWNDAVANPEEATDIVMKAVADGSTTRKHQLNMMKEVSKLVIPAGKTAADIGRIDDQLFKRTADIALKFGVVKTPADLTKSYTNSIIDKAKAAQ